MKIQIVDYEASMRPEWEVMVSTYWIQDLGESGTAETIREICDMVEQQWESSMVSVAVLQSEGKSIGFCVYQIDTPASDWCKRQGWGMLREFYVEKSYRGRGFGTALAAYAEQKLREMGAVDFYLTADNAVGFWETCGYVQEEGVNENGTYTMTKHAVTALKQTRLEAYEKMRENVLAEFSSMEKQMEELKAQGKVKSATYRQLMGRKMTYQTILKLYELYGIR